MTAKEAFRLADSIVRYDARQGFTTSFDFDDSRDTALEMATIPDRFIGAAYRRHAFHWHWGQPNLNRPPGRIMKMYNDKLYDAEQLKTGWHVQRPNGYGVVAGKMVLKRIRPVPVRMT